MNDVLTKRLLELQPEGGDALPQPLPLKSEHEHNGLIGLSLSCDGLHWTPLTHYFGFDAFRSGQEDAVLSIFSISFGRPVLLNISINCSIRT